MVWDQVADVLQSRLGLDLHIRLSLQASLLLAAALSVGVLAWSFRWLGQTWPSIAGHVRAAQLLPVTALIVFAQMVDAFATSIGIDLGGYDEKHVLSEGLIRSTCETFGGSWPTTQCVSSGAWFGFGAEHPTFFGFAPVKLLVSILVIYAIDVSGHEESRKNPTLIGLVKFAVIMVGIGPGVRDFVRMSLGI